MSYNSSGFAKLALISLALSATLIVSGSERVVESSVEHFARSKRDSNRVPRVLSKRDALDERRKADLPKLDSSRPKNDKEAGDELRRKSDKIKDKAKDKKHQFELDCLRAHNKWRALHDAPPLKIDSKLTKFAQKRATHIADSDGDEFKHPDDLDYGENLAWNSRASTSCEKLVKLWYDEEKLYDYKDASFSHEAGHFTQLVWKTTERVGCAYAISSKKKGGIYLVCNYDPPGNWKGEFKENVFRSTDENDENSQDVTRKPTGASTYKTTVAYSSSTTATASSTGRAISPSTTVASVTTTTTTTTAAPVKPTATPSTKPASSTKKPTPKKKKKKSKKKKKKSAKKNKSKKKTSTTTTSTSTTTSTTTLPSIA